MSRRTHEEQKQRALADSLRSAGIGSAYHRRSLTEKEFPPALFDWVSSPQEHIAAGRGWTFTGGPASYDAAMLMARGLHIQGLGSLVVPSSRLASWVRADAPDLDRVMEVRALVVTGFYEDYHEPPMQGWVAAGVEEVLTARLDENRTVMLQMGKTFDSDCWWTRNFVSMVTARNRSLQL